MQKTINNQKNKNDFYVVGGSYNTNSYEDLLEFKKKNNNSFSLTTRDELGFRYPDNFSSTFTFIGKNNRIIGTLEADATPDEMEVMMKRTISSFYGITSLKDKDNILLTEDIINVDLNDYFHIADNSPVDFFVGSSSNPNILEYEIIGRNLILTKAAVKGFSELKILAQVPDKDAYVQTTLDVINPTSLIEDFEIASLENSALKWINSGDAGWFITDEMSYFNKKSVRSGQVSLNQSSGLSVELDLKETGTLIFAYKTSSRHYYDRLNFCIDSINYSEMQFPDPWSGLNDWKILSFNVEPGIKNFSWEYIKGSYTPDANYNGDTVWLDLIVLPDQSNKDNFANADKETELINYPNPFNPSTEIRFELIKNETIELTVFDIKGRQVADIHKGMLDKGKHSFSFDGSGLSSGIYYSVLKYGGKIITGKMILAK